MVKIIKINCFGQKYAPNSFEETFWLNEINLAFLNTQNKKSLLTSIINFCPRSSSDDLKYLVITDNDKCQTGALKPGITLELDVLYFNPLKNVKETVER